MNPLLNSLLLRRKISEQQETPQYYDSLGRPLPYAAYPFTIADAIISSCIVDLQINHSKAFKHPYYISEIHDLNIPGNLNHIVIKDDAGTTVLSTSNEGYTYTKEINGNFAYHLWKASSANVSLPTLFIKEDLTANRDYITEEVYYPNAQLNERTILEINGYIDTINNLKTPTLLYGTNTEFLCSEQPNSWQINFEAGAGTGQYDNTSETYYITSINGVPPTADGAFFLYDGKCFLPRNVLNTENPQQLIPQEITPGILQLTNTCKVCCDCDTYYLFYSYLRTLYEKAETLIGKVNNIKNRLATNSKTATEHYLCVIENTSRLSTYPICPEGGLGTMLSMCNNDTECWTIKDASVIIDTTKALSGQDEIAYANDAKLINILNYYTGILSAATVTFFCVPGFIHTSTKAKTDPYWTPYKPVADIWYDVQNNKVKFGYKITMIGTGAYPEQTLPPGGMFNATADCRLVVMSAELHPELEQEISGWGSANMDDFKLKSLIIYTKQSETEDRTLQKDYGSLTIPECPQLNDTIGGTKRCKSFKGWIIGEEEAGDVAW